MSCDGRCCAVFQFPQSPTELRARWEHGIDPSWEGSRELWEKRMRDDLYIADMLIELDPVETLERMLKFGIEPLSDDYTNRFMYTCRHWNEDTRLCMAYSDRPEMCAEYPYGRKCDHANMGCTFESPAHVTTTCAARRVAGAARG